MNVGSMAFFLFALESMNTNLEIVAIKKLLTYSDSVIVTGSLFRNK